jgi:transposase-like protein
MKTLPRVSCTQLRCWYEVERLGVAAIAQRVGCSPATISNWLRRCAIPARSGRFVARPVDRRELERLYLEERLPVAKIAAVFGVSVGTINNRRRAYGIPKRTLSTPAAPSADQRENSLHFR